MQSGGVFGLDAPFGHGKTFFLKGLQDELRSDQFTVAYFDVWKADLAAHPLFLFVSDVLAQLAQQGVRIEDKRELGEKLKLLASAVARVGLKSVLRAGDDDFDKLVEPFVSEVDRLDFSNEGEAAKAMALAGEVEAAGKAFSDATQALLVDSTRRVPLVILLDELDRARPDFAIEFLEALKFIFSTGNVVFCVAVDRANLTASIRARFGESYDVDQYLARLFEFWIRLDNPPRNEHFMVQALKKRALVSDSLLLDDESIDRGAKFLAKTAIIGLGRLADNLRSIERCAERAALCLRSLQDPKWAGLVGFLCGLSLSDRDFLKEYVLPQKQLKARSPPQFGVSPIDPHPDFLNRLRTRTENARDQVPLAGVVAWGLAPEVAAVENSAIGDVFSSGVASIAAQFSAQISSSRRILGRSPASVVYDEIGWTLG